MFERILYISFYRFINFLILGLSVIFISRVYGIDILGNYNLYISIITPLIIFSFFDINSKIIGKSNQKIDLNFIYTILLISFFLIFICYFFFPKNSILIIIFLVIQKINEGFAEISFTYLRKEFKEKKIFILSLTKILIFLVTIFLIYFFNFSFNLFVIITTLSLIIFNLIFLKNIIKSKMNFQNKKRNEMLIYFNSNFKIGISLLLKNLQTYLIRYNFVLFSTPFLFGSNTPIFYLINILGFTSIIFENLLSPSLIKNNLKMSIKSIKIIILFSLTYFISLSLFDFWINIYFQLFKIPLTEQLLYGSKIVTYCWPAFVLRSIFKIITFYKGIENYQFFLQLLACSILIICFVIFRVDLFFENVYLSLLITNYVIVLVYIYLLSARKKN